MITSLPSNQSSNTTMPPRTPRVEYSPHKRTRIKMKYDLGTPLRRIAFEEGVSPGSISGIIRRYDKQKSATSNPRKGRPPKLSEQDKRSIFRCIQQNPFISPAEIIENTGLEISTRTLIRYLKKEGILHQKAVRRPLLTPEAAAERLKFAKEHCNEPPEYWYRWIFSDESTVARGDGERQDWVFCPQGERMNPIYIQPKAKPTRHSQMFWASFSFFARTSLWSLFGDPESRKGGVSAQRILECLQEQLPTIASPGSIFAQDNAPTHKARLVQDWLKGWAEENGVKLVEWPPYSPDLNPIENLWKLLKERICERYPHLASMPKNQQSLILLRRAATEVWEDFDEELLQKLILSMPRRLKAVVKAKGWYTKY